MKLSKLFNTTRIIATALFVSIAVFGLHAEDKVLQSHSAGQNLPALKAVESKYVCMVNNQLFQKEQIPVTVEGKTYYGCCEMCKGMLANDSKNRVAVDPISGKQVDKAESVTAANSKGEVYYFENEKNLEMFRDRINN